MNKFFFLEFSLLGVIKRDILKKVAIFNDKNMLRETWESSLPNVGNQASNHIFSIDAFARLLEHLKLILT